MGELQNATDQARRLAKDFKAFILVVEAADRLGGIEQGEREAVSRREAANKAADQAEKSAREAQEALKAEKAKVDVVAQKNLASLDAALKDAEGVVAKANVKADEIVKAAVERKAALEALIGTLQGKLTDLGKQLDSRNADLIAVEKKIAGLKAMASGIVGA